MRGMTLGLWMILSLRRSRRAEVCGSLVLEHCPLVASVSVRLGPDLFDSLVLHVTMVLKGEIQNEMVVG